MCAIAEKVEQVQKQEMELRKQLAECERERDEARNQCVKCGLLDAAKEQLATVTKERDEAVDAVRKLSEGQPFNAVVAADITRRGLEQLAAVTKERDELAALNARMLVEYEARMKERDELVVALTERVLRARAIC